MNMTAVTAKVANSSDDSGKNQIFVHKPVVVKPGNEFAVLVVFGDMRNVFHMKPTFLGSYGALGCENGFLTVGTSQWSKSFRI